jgi:subtilisin-like proprotein convertase family protein
VSGLVALLLASAAGPALAGGPHQERHSGGHEHQQEQEGSAAGKRKSGKTKTIKRTFTNAESIVIPAEDAAVDFGPADPYPSTIDVAGFKKAKLTDLNLTLRGFSHEFPSDVQLLLVAPGGRNAVVMGDVGDSSDGATDPAVAELTLTLDDEAANLLPDEEILTSGSFRPLDGAGPGPEGDLSAFPAPAPEPSGENALSTFDGINPNGEWQLFALDDDQTDDGGLTDWTLEITAKAKTKKKRH